MKLSGFPRHPELVRGRRLSLRTLTDEDLPDVARIYRNNPRFFTLLTGHCDIDERYVLSEMKDGPPGFDANKYFLGLHLLSSGDLVGVADFVADYPSQGNGCLGLLLLTEAQQGNGLGQEAAELVETWAVREHGVRRVTLGVELVNERARRFWRRCGYQPTGEVFTSTVLGVEHAAEALVKHLRP